MACAPAAPRFTATRGSDTVARLGGDEFGVLLVGRSDADVDADVVTARLVASVSQPVAVGGREVSVGASVGLARGAAGEGADVLIHNADTAMYAAKHAGKGAAAWFAPAMHAAALERAGLLADIGPALARGELWLAFQPIVALGTGRVGGLEAPVPWTYPERGPLEPAAFIPVAEASGAIVPLGRWVLGAACRTVAPVPGEPYVTVNLSGRKIDESFVDRIDEGGHDAALVRTIVALGEMLGLTTVAEGVERAAQRERLSALGCAMGQGYLFARPLDAAGVAAFLAAGGAPAVPASGAPLPEPARALASAG